MTHWFRRDRPDRPLLQQMRDLHNRPQTARVIYAEPDARVQMQRFSKWQAMADRILKRRAG